jgi:hypothetical protein
MCAGHTSRVKFDRCLLNMCRNLVTGDSAAFQRVHYHNPRHDLVLHVVSQHGEHPDVILLPSRLLQYPPSVTDYDGVGSDDDRGLAALFVVDFALVHLHRFGFGSLEDIGRGTQLMGIVLGERGRAYVNFCQADLVDMSFRMIRRFQAVSTCARSCLLRGEADASTIRPCLNVFNTGRFSGGGGPGGGLRTTLGAAGASSYGGGGSDSKRLFLSMAAVDVCLNDASRAMGAVIDLQSIPEDAR